MKVISWPTLFLLFLVLAGNISAGAQDYVSSQFPSNEALIRTINSMPQVSDERVGRLLGKFREAENLYRIYYIDTRGENFWVKIRRLDNNIWIVERANEKSYRVLQGQK